MRSESESMTGAVFAFTWSTEHNPTMGCTLDRNDMIVLPAILPTLMPECFKRIDNGHPHSQVMQNGVPGVNVILVSTNSNLSHNQQGGLVTNCAFDIDEEITFLNPVDESLPVPSWAQTRLVLANITSGDRSGCVFCSGPPIPKIHQFCSRGCAQLISCVPNDQVNVKLRWYWPDQTMLPKENFARVLVAVATKSIWRGELLVMSCATLTSDTPPDTTASWSLFSSSHPSPLPKVPSTQSRPMLEIRQPQAPSSKAPHLSSSTRNLNSSLDKQLTTSKQRPSTSTSTSKSKSSTTISSSAQSSRRGRSRHIPKQVPIPILQGSSDGAIDLTQSPSSPLYAPAPDPMISLPQVLEIGGNDVGCLQREPSIQPQDDTVQPRIIKAPLQNFSVDGVPHSVFLDSTYPSRQLVAQFMQQNIMTSGLPGPHFVTITACNQLCEPPLLPRYDIPMSDQDVVLKCLISVVCGDVLRTVNCCGDITVTKLTLLLQCTSPCPSTPITCTVDDSSETSVGVIVSLCTQASILLQSCACEEDIYIGRISCPVLMAGDMILFDPKRCCPTTFQGPGSDDLIFLPSIFIELSLEMRECALDHSLPLLPSTTNLRFPSICVCVRCCRPIVCRDLTKIAQCTMCTAVDISVICDACVSWPSIHNHDIINAGLCAHSTDAICTINSADEVQIHFWLKFTLYCVQILLYLTIQELKSSAMWLAKLYVNNMMLTDCLVPAFLKLSGEDQLTTMLSSNLRQCKRAITAALVVMAFAGIVDGGETLRLNPTTAFHNLGSINEGTIRHLCQQLQWLCKFDRADLSRMGSLSSSFRHICFDGNGNLKFSSTLQCECGLCINGAPTIFHYTSAMLAIYKEAPSSDEPNIKAYTKILNDELNN